jgi:hypothetical protein
MKKRCKRKVWSTSINPVAHAIAGASVSDKQSLDKLRLYELSAIDAMIKGMGTTEDWRWLADVMNIAETMGNHGIGIEVLPVCEIVQAEMEAAARRYEKSRKMGLSGTGIRYIKELYALHDLQRQSISRTDFERMIEKTINYIRSNHHRVVHIT